MSVEHDQVDKSGEWHLNTEQPIYYTIKNSPNVLDPTNKDMLSVGTQGPGIRRVVVVDLKVSHFYIKEIVKYFVDHDVNYHLIILDAVEEKKNIESLIYLLTEIEKFGLTRKSEPIIAIGGGVLLDIVGLAASLYRRGVPYIRVPTTLLGIVDASVGVKTAINFEDRRNRLGTYYPAIASYLDIDFLKTLEHIEITSGMGEILKMAVVKDSRLFTLLKNSAAELLEKKFLNCKDATEVIDRSVKGMKDELQENLWEKDLKRYVDFGHSFSPIPEMRSLVDDSVETLTHGQAVCLDVIFSCILSMNRGLLPRAEVIDVIVTAKKCGLPIFHPYFSNADILMEALQDTTKHRNGDQNLPIPVSIGNSIFLNDVTYSDIQNAAQGMMLFHQELG